jgi:peptidoglycan/xylan/chitin deacetylase (PgdA/CDA1 family)
VLRRLTPPVGTVRAVRTARPHLVLTYDDGPDPPGTEAVLTALAEHRATATFFVLVARARRHRRLLNEIAAAGHEIGLHGIDHRRLTGLPAREVLRRTAAGRAELEDLLAAPVRWFRPPYGAQLPVTWWAIRRAGLTPVVWGPTAADWLPLPEPELAARAMVGAAPGAILLAHDGWPGPDVGVDDGPVPPIDRGRLAKLLLAGLAEQGLVARSLRDALVDGVAARWAWFRR